MKTKGRKKTMIDFNFIFNSFAGEVSGNQKKLDIQSAVGVYYGFSKDGNLRISFMSANKPPKMESTKVLQVTQGVESQNVYWTCFDLLQQDAKKVFFAFCSNLVDSVTDIFDEQKALLALKKRYITWKTMFKRDTDSKISQEVLQGLYGELYFLKSYMLDKYSIEVAVNAWSGPDAKSKDFSVETDWYEVKTVGANATSVRISSLTQLDSENDGHLVIVKVEAMSDEFDNGASSVGEIFKYIFERIKDETVEGIFLSKLSSYGFDISDKTFDKRFDVKSLNLYLVNGNFPRLTEKKVPYAEMTDISYSLIINSLACYMEE